MGAIFITEIASKGTNKELQERFNHLRSESLAMHGHERYSGEMGTKDDIEAVARVGVFNSSDDAFQYLVDECDKNGPALAVKVASFNKTTSKQIEQVNTKITAIKKQPYMTGEAILNIRDNAVNRARLAKSKMKTCSGCQSKIAQAHIKNYRCPVCDSDQFVMTATDNRKIAKAFDQQDEGELKVASLEERIKNIKALSDTKDWYWLIGASCPS